MIRFLLFLRAWHAELRLWRHGLRRSLNEQGALPEETLYRMSETVNQYWVDFSCGYVRLR